MAKEDGMPGKRICRNPARDLKADVGVCPSDAVKSENVVQQCTASGGSDQVATVSCDACERGQGRKDDAPVVSSPAASDLTMIDAAEESTMPTTEETEEAGTMLLGIKGPLRLAYEYPGRVQSHPSPVLITPRTLVPLRLDPDEEGTASDSSMWDSDVDSAIVEYHTHRDHSPFPSSSEASSREFDPRNELRDDTSESASDISVESWDFERGPASGLETPPRDVDLLGVEDLRGGIELEEDDGQEFFDAQEGVDESTETEVRGERVSKAHPEGEVNQKDDLEITCWTIFKKACSAVCLFL